MPDDKPEDFAEAAAADDSAMLFYHLQDSIREVGLAERELARARAREQAYRYEVRDRMEAAKAKLVVYGSTVVRLDLSGELHVTQAVAATSLARLTKPETPETGPDDDAPTLGLERHDNGRVSLVSAS